ENQSSADSDALQDAYALKDTYQKAFASPDEQPVNDGDSVQTSDALSTEQAALASTPLPAAASDAEDEDEDEVDNEIIDIFVEEAEEVIQTIAEYFPRWAINFDDSESLTEFRRAFHTLKGSGRMVGANDIGELAWSIENMLNRVIDG